MALGDLDPSALLVSHGPHPVWQELAVWGWMMGESGDEESNLELASAQQF